MTTASQPLSRVQVVWFALLTLAGLIFALLMPPLKGADEWAHWTRALTVANGEWICDSIPAELEDVGRVLFHEPRSDGEPWFTLKRLERVSRITWTTERDEFPGGLACQYVPLAYAASALGLEVARHVSDSVIVSFYAARVTSWFATMTLLLCLLWGFSRARYFLLVFFSVPQVLHQCACLNTEWAIFATGALLVFAVMRSPTFGALATTLAASIALTAVKVVFAFTSVFVYPHLLAFWRARRHRWHALALLPVALLAPAATWYVWRTMSYVEVLGWTPDWGVDPEAQVAYLKENPGAVFGLAIAQIKSAFGPELMRGSWMSAFGAFGASEVTLPLWGHVGVLLALASGTTADLMRADVYEADHIRRAPFARSAMNVAILSSLPATALAMYVYFSTVGDTQILGVQGRYYLPVILMLGLLNIPLARAPRCIIESKHAPWIRRLGVFLAVAGALVGIIAGFVTVFFHFWWWGG